MLLPASEDGVAEILCHDVLQTLSPACLRPHPLSRSLALSLSRSLALSVSLSLSLSLSVGVRLYYERSLGVCLSSCAMDSSMFRCQSLKSGCLFCAQLSVWNAMGALRVRVPRCEEQHQLYDVILQMRALMGRGGA